MNIYWIKLIMALVWVFILAMGIVVFLKGFFEANIFLIRVSCGIIFLSVPTLISIIKEEKK